MNNNSYAKLTKHTLELSCVIVSEYLTVTREGPSQLAY